VSDDLFPVVWLGGAALIAFVVNAYATWVHLITGEDVSTIRIFSMMSSVWPLVALLLPFALAGFLAYWAPKRVMVVVLERRKALAERERAAQREADARRYVDDGALR
jgi:hypothetical protein